MAITEWILANAMWMVVGVTALLLVYYIIKLIEGIRKRRRTISSLEIILQIWALLFLIFIVSMGNNLKPADWVQVILLGGLVTVTAVYTGASVKMAKEMREQRLAEVQPCLLLRLNPKEDKFVRWYEWESPLDLESRKRTTKLPLAIRNEGKGTAINVEAYLWEPAHPHNCGPYNKTGYLAPRDEWQTDMSGFSVGIDEYEWFPELKEKMKEVVKHEYPRIVVLKYNDIQKQRTWISYLCLEEKVHPLEDFIMEAEQNIVELKSQDL